MQGSMAKISPPFCPEQIAIIHAEENAPWMKKRMSGIVFYRKSKDVIKTAKVTEESELN